MTMTLTLALTLTVTPYPNTDPKPDPNPDSDPNRSMHVMITKPPAKTLAEHAATAAAAAEAASLCVVEVRTSLRAGCRRAGCRGGDAVAVLAGATSTLEVCVLDANGLSAGARQ